MRTAGLSVIRSVTLPDRKHVWRIKDEDTVVIDDTPFVRLNKWSSTLSSLLGNVGGFMCLKRSQGLDALQELRKTASEHDAETDECSLFDVQKTPKKRAVSKGAMNSARQHPQIVDVGLQLQGEAEPIAVRLIKAVHPTDCVWVEFKEEPISAVIQFLIEGGFNGSKRAKHADQQLPVGVQRRKAGFRVKFKHENKYKFKCVRSMEDAIRFHADPSAYLEAETEVVDDDDDDADDDAEAVEAEELAELEQAEMPGGDS